MITTWRSPVFQLDIPASLYIRNHSLFPLDAKFVAVIYRQLRLKFACLNQIFIFSFTQWMISLMPLFTDNSVSKVACSNKIFIVLPPVNEKFVAIVYRQLRLKIACSNQIFIITFFYHNELYNTLQLHCIEKLVWYTASLSLVAVAVFPLESGISCCCHFFVAVTTV